MVIKTSTVKSQDGIEWYVKQQGTGPNLVLVPSGEGDCSSFDKVAAILSKTFSVTSFDMPGFSRSIAPESAFNDPITTRLISKQIVGLLDELDIKSTHVYGCSSGGVAVLGLVADYPDRVISAIVHEVPMGPVEPIDSLTKLDDAAVVAACKTIFGKQLCEDEAAWEALGPEYHARLEKNYVTWVRNYVGKATVITKWTDEELKQRPITWTIGSLLPAGFFFDNVQTAMRNGIPISLLPCKHFPQVSVPEQLAEHIEVSALRMGI